MEQSRSKNSQLSATESVYLLDELQSGDDWKASGIAVRRQVTHLEIQLPSRKKRKKDELAPESQYSTSKTSHEEVIRLSSQTGTSLLEANKASISFAANIERERYETAIKMLFDMLVDVYIEGQQKELDLSARNFDWQRAEISRLIFHHKDAEGRVFLQENGFCWQACVKRDGYVGNSTYFLKLANAIDSQSRSKPVLDIKRRLHLRQTRLMTKSKIRPPTLLQDKSG